MRNRALALFAFASLFLAALPAFAEPCSKTVYANVANRYVFTDNGATVDSPVFQGGVTYTCKGWSYDLWTSTDLSTPGRYGHRGYGDEIDATVTNAGKIAGVEYKVSGAYWLLSDFGNFDDDVIAIYADFGHSFKAGAVTVMPYVRGTEWLGTKDFPNTSLIRAGARINVPISEKVSLDIDTAESRDFTDDLNTAYADITLARNFGSFSLSVNTKLIQRTKPAFNVGFSKSF